MYADHLVRALTLERVLPARLRSFFSTHPSPHLPTH